MSRSSAPFRRSALLLALAWSGGVLQGCVPSAEGGPVDKKAVKAARRAKMGVGGKKQARQAARFSSAFSAAGRKPGDPEAIYAPAAGYIVKGTDYLAFWPCDSTGYYYLAAGQMVNAKISQQYKFSAPRPYTPMYAELRLSYVEDTLRRGDHLFTRYADVIDYTATARDEAKCKPPSRNTLSTEMERLDQFKPTKMNP
ncbi:MAG: hypothetical protein ABI910_11185 [Gemmatimonadota bacterium]